MFQSPESPPVENGAVESARLGSLLCCFAAAVALLSLLADAALPVECGRVLSLMLLRCCCTIAALMFARRCAVAAMLLMLLRCHCDAIYMLLLC